MKACWSKSFSVKKLAVCESLLCVKASLCKSLLCVKASLFKKLAVCVNACHV